MPRRYLRAAIITTIAAFVVAIGCSEVTPPPKPPVPTTLSLSGPSSAAGVVTNGVGACTLPLVLTGTGGDAEATLNSATGTITYTGLATQTATSEPITPALLQQWFTVTSVKPGESFTAQRVVSRDRAFKVKHEVSYTAGGTARTLSHEFTCDWPPVSAVTLDLTAAQTLAPGATKQLAATPKDAAGIALSGRLLAWASTDPTIATVSPTGLVTAIKSGTTKVSATSEDKKSAELTFNVVIPVAKVVITPKFRAMNVSESVTLTAEARDADGKVLTGRTFEWTRIPGSGGPSLGFIQSLDGGRSGQEIKGTGLGEGLIVASVEGKADTATVRVEEKVASVVVTPSPVAVSVGRTVQLKAIPKSATGAELTPRPTHWENLNGEGYLTVDSTGLVTGVKALGAQFTIIATMEAKNGSAAVTVRQPTDSVVLSHSEIQVPRGTTLEINARFRSATGTFFSDKRDVEWVSGDTNIVKVVSSSRPSSGNEVYYNVIGRKAGQTNIVGSHDGKSTTVPVDVQLPVTSINITPDSISLPMLLTRQLTAAITDSVGPVTRKVLWETRSSSIARPDTNGVVTPVAVGTTWIVGTSETKVDSTKVVVIPAVTSVVLTPAADSVQVGDILQFSASARINGATVNRPIELTSSDTEVATVDTTGLVTGVAVGSVSLIAKSEIKADTSIVKVLARQPVAAVTLAPTASYVPVGDKLPLVATIKDASGMTLRGRAVAWTSSLPSVATVDEKGVVTAIALGKTTITGTSEGKTVTRELDVVKPIAIITITPASDTLQPGQTVQLVATLKDAQGGVITGREMQWSSGNSTVASISATGLVTAQGLGVSQIRLRVDGKEGLAAILVVAPVAIVEVGPEIARVPLPGTLALTPTPKDQDGNVLFARTFTWSSSNPAIATVNSAGVVTAVALGTATISATSEGKTGTRSVTVSRPVATVTVTPATQTVPADVPVKLTATMKDATNATLTGGTIVWSTSNPAIATVASDGTVTPLSAGTVTISASIEGKTGTATLTVFMPVASVVISATNPRIVVDRTLELDAVTLDKNGATLLGRAVTWSSSNPGVVTVDANGLLTGKSEGTATITATSEGKSGTVTVTSAYPVTGVLAQPFDTRLDVGGTAQLSALAFGPQGDTLKGRTVVWAAENPSIATITSTGAVRAVAPGSARMIAFIDEAWGTAFVVVDTPPLSQVIVSPSTLTMPVGKSATLTATLKNSVGGTITGKSVTWTTSDVNMAIVNGGRVETSFKPGTVTITATAEGKSGTATITIPPIGNVASITLSMNSTTILMGQKPFLFAQLLDPNGVDMQNKSPQPTVTWTQTDPTVLSVEGSMGATLTPLKPGTTTLTATSEGKTAQITVTVVPAGTVGSLTVTPSSHSMLVGQTKQLTSKLLDASGTLINGATYTFATSDATIASVSTNGTVTALKAGTATITVTSSGKTATATIIVGRPSIFLLEVTPENSQALVNETRQFAARIIDNTATVLTDRQVTWTSQDTRIATVNSAGLVTAKMLGNTAICAASEGQNDCGFINVVSAMPQVGQVKLSHDLVEMWGFGYTQTQQLTATVHDGGGVILFGIPLTWATSNPSVATVSPTGLVTSAGSGATMITATAQGKADTAWFLVDQRKIFSMYIVGPYQMQIGEKATYQVRLNDASGNILSSSGRVFTWKSSNPSVMSVDANGVATANAFGAAEIQVSSEGKVATFQVTVSALDDPVVSVDITPKADTIWVDSTAHFTAGYTRASGKRFVADGRIRFTSSDPTVASIPEYGAVYGWYTDIIGTAKGLKAGKSTITASVGGKSATAEVIVVPPPPVATVTLTPNPTEIVVNTGEYIGYTLKDASGKPLGVRPITWSIANSSIATVNQEGWIVGKTIGTTTVTAVSEGKTGTATVKIVAAAPAVGSVTVSPNPASASLGGSVQLSATVRDATGTILTGRAITWTSNNTSVATVSGSGLVSGKTTGTVTITATSGGKSGSATVNIGSSSSGGSGGSGGGSTSGGLCESWVSVAAPAANTETPWKALPFPNGMDWKIKHSRGFGVSTYTVHFRNRYVERIYFSATGPSKNKPTETRFALSAAANGGTTSNYEYPENPTTLWVYVAGVRFGSFSAKQYCGN